MSKRPKIYLSPAAHATDNPCAHSPACGENIHANLYVDELIPYLDACGFDWKRANRANTGQKLRLSVAESNAWGADLHYTVHTNAANGRAQGSRPMVWPTGKGRAWAGVLLQYRREVYPYPCAVKVRSDLYELSATRATAIYEELVFHDNPEDAAWLHAHMRELAAQTARAFCGIFGLAFVDPYAVPGDIDGDGDVDTTDARLALQAAVGKAGLDAEQTAAGDINGDGKVDTTDARLILQSAVGKRAAGETAGAHQRPASETGGDKNASAFLRRGTPPPQEVEK